MDIEGGELIFIQENIDFIKNQINKITFEVHGHLIYGDSSPLSRKFNNDCFNLLINNGFTLKDKHSNVYSNTKGWKLYSYQSITWKFRNPQYD